MWRLGMIICAVAGVLGGCAYADKQPLRAEGISDDQLVAMAMDPLRPLQDRTILARELDAAGRQQLETGLLADLPALWGLEWRERLALLRVVGGPETVETLQGMMAGGDVPQTGRARRAIAETIKRVESRVSSAESTRRKAPVP